MKSTISRSDAYSLGTLAVLALLLWIDEPIAMLIVSLVGLGLGIVLGARDTLKRSGVVAAVGFAVAIAMAALAMVR